MLRELIDNPPVTGTYHDVVKATGPGFLTRVFYANAEKYEGVRVEPRPVFSPYRMRGRNERQVLLNSGVTHGIHHAWGSWRERWSLTYLRTKAAKLLRGYMPGPQSNGRKASSRQLPKPSPRRAA